jgi:chromosomal replication initiator protein
MLQQKLQEVDVLMLDDIQFLAGKERTQEIFHTIFNDFYSKKKQIILTSDRPPKELTLLESRLQSRFALGLVADIKTPDTETRVAILQSKLKAKGQTLDDELLQVIAEVVNTNVRELE